MDRLGSFLSGLQAELQRLNNVGSKMKHELMDQQAKVKCEVEKLLFTVHVEEKRKLVSPLLDTF